VPGLTTDEINELLARLDALPLIHENREYNDSKLKKVAYDALYWRHDAEGSELLRSLLSSTDQDARILHAVTSFVMDNGIDPLEVFGFELIRNAALDYLEAATFTNQWAWGLVWFGDWNANDHLRLVKAIVDSAPDDDGALWMLGDGPISELEEREELAADLAELHRTNARWKRIKQHVIADLEVGDYNRWREFPAENYGF